MIEVRSLRLLFVSGSQPLNHQVCLPVCVRGAQHAPSISLPIDLVWPVETSNTRISSLILPISPTRPASMISVLLTAAAFQPYPGKSPICNRVHRSAVGSYRYASPKIVTPFV